MKQRACCTHLLKLSLSLLIGQQRDGAHQVAHQHKVTLHLHIQGDDVVEVAALQPQLFLGCPLKQPHLPQKVRVSATGNCKQGLRGAILSVLASQTNCHAGQRKCTCQWQISQPQITINRDCYFSAIHSNSCTCHRKHLCQPQITVNRDCGVLFFLCHPLSAVLSLPSTQTAAPATKSACVGDTKLCCHV